MLRMYVNVTHAFIQPLNKIADNFLQWAHDQTGSIPQFLALLGMMWIQYEVYGIFGGFLISTSKIMVLFFL